MKVKKYQFKNKTFVSIVDEFDCPIDVYAACYINSKLSAKSFNTTLRYANELHFILSFFSERSIDLTSRVASEKFISYSEYYRFYEFCHFQKNSQSNSNLILFPNVENKHLRNAMIANERRASMVSPETIQGRIRQFRKYFEWLYDQFHGGNQVCKTIDDYFHKLICKIKIDERSFGKNSDLNPVNPTESVIPDIVFANLLEMILPHSPNNPFKSSKVRNYLIISLLIQTGMRRGALAKIKISDCRFYGSYDRIAIYRTLNDITDPRLEKPNQKTKAHDVTIDKKLMENIKFYIDHIRSQLPTTTKHDFIFVSEKNSKGTLGNPISLKTINNIFKTISSALNFHLNPHLLRHKWNEIFDEAGEDKKIDRRLLEDMRKHAMGWTQNSNMGQLYNDKALQKKTAELMSQHQERINKQK